ncbi:MAG TPA: LEPR-XLL domain-containing protein, partial [Lacunisphaera sp.]|nr:LEPR-XLL domain-containing protein [Lacunisphaera sp.]
MSLRHREFTLEPLEQRMLLSGDGLMGADLLPTLQKGHGAGSAVEVVLVNDRAPAAPTNSNEQQNDSLVDTTPVVQTVEQATETPAAPVTAPKQLPTSNPAPANPDVQTAADFSVETLTAGNGPPASGINHSSEDLDPPFGGFNFTAGSTPEADALDALFDTGTGSAVTMHGTIVKRVDNGGSTYSLGQLSLNGTFTIAPHLNGAVTAVDSAGNFVFEVSYTSALTSATLQAGGLTLTLGSDKGAFLVSGNLPSPDDGGLAGTMSLTSIALTGSVGNTLSFGTITSGTLTLNTASAVANGTATSGTDIGGTGYNPTFTSTGNFLRMAGTSSVEVVTSSVDVTLKGDFGFEIKDVNGTQSVAFALNSGEADLTVGGVTVAATGLAGTFYVNSSGVAGWASIGAISATGLPSGLSFGELSGVIVKLNTTGSDVSATVAVGSDTSTFSYSGTSQRDFFQVSGTVAVNVNQGGISAKIKGLVTFDRSTDTVSSASILRVAVSGASSSFTAGTTTLDITGINGAFVINSDGFAGKASVGGLQLTGVTGLTFNITSLFFEINTTNTSISDSIADGGSTVVLDFTAPDRHQFFQVEGTVQLAVAMGGITASLDGSFYFKQYDPDGAGSAPNVVEFAATSATASFTVGAVTVKATGVSGGFVLNNAGVAGYVNATGLSLTGITGLTASATGVQFAINTTGADASASFDVGGTTISFNFNTIDRHSFVQASGTVTFGVDMGGISASLTGSYYFEQYDADGAGGNPAVIKLATTGATASFTVGAVTVKATGVSGGFLINDAGVAGYVNATGLSLDGITGLTASATGVQFAINTTGADASASFDVGGTTISFNYNTSDRHSFVQASGTVTFGVDMGGITASLTGSYYFEQYDADGAGGDPAVIKFAATDASAEFSAGNIDISVSHVTGGFVINDHGIAGFVHASHGTDNIFSISGISGVTVSATALDFEINTTGADAAATFDVGSQHVAFDYTVAGGESDFVRAGGTITLGLTLPSVSVSLSGSLAFESGTITDPVSSTTSNVVKIGGEHLSSTVTIGGVELDITEVSGIVVLTDNGAAGRVEIGSLSVLHVSGFTMSATGFAIEFNNTNHSINEALNVGGVSQTLSYTAATEQNFFRGSGTATIAFSQGSFTTTLTGTFGFEQFTMADSSSVVKFAFTDVSFEIGVSTAKLVINDADGFFIFGQNSSGDTSYAGKLAISDAELQGVNGLTLTVTDFNFEVNTFGEAVTASITRPSLPSFELDFSAADKWDFISLGGTLHLGVTLGGFTSTLIGTFYFEKATVTLNAGTADERDEDIIKISVSGASFDLTAGSVTLSAGAINGAFLIQGDGKSAGDLSIGSVALTGISGFTFTVDDFRLQFNNTGGAVSVNIPVPGSATGVDLAFTDAAEYNFIRVGGTLTVGVTLGGFSTNLHATFLFEQTTDTIQVGVKDGNFDLTAGSVTFAATDVNGAFLFNNDGTKAVQLKVGHVGLTGISGLTFTVDDFFLSLNDTGGPVHETLTFADSSTAAIDFDGDIVAVGGTLTVGVDLGGFSTNLHATFLFEQTTDTIQIGVKDGSFDLTAGSVTFSATQIDGAFVFYNDGTKAVQLKIGHVGLTGITGLTFAVDDFFLNLNDTGGAVHEDLTFGDGSTATIDFTGDIVAVGGTLTVGVTLGGFSTNLHATFLFEQTTDTIQIGVKDGSFDLTAGSVTFAVTDVNGAFLFNNDGTKAVQLKIGHVGLTGITGLTFTVDDFFLSLNDTGGPVHETLTFGDGSTADIDFDGDIVAVGGTLTVGVDLGGFSTNLHATFLFEQTTDTIQIGVKDGSFDLTAGSVTFAVTDVNGAFLFNNDGTKAVQLKIGHVGLTGITGLTFTVDDFFLSLNDTGGPVHETLTFGDGSTADIDFDGDIVAVGGTLTVGVDLGGFSTNLHATFLFEQTTDTIQIGVKDGSFDLTAGSVTFAVTDVNGAFLFNNDGTKAVQLKIGHVGLTGITGFTFTVDDFFLSLNDTGGPVHETLTFGDSSTADIDFDGDIVAVGGTLHLGLTVGSFSAEVHGTFLFEQTTGKLKIGLKDAGLTIQAGTVKFVVDDMDGAFVVYDGGKMAATMSIHTVHLDGITGFTFVVDNFNFQINTTNGPVTETLTFGDGSSTDISFTTSDRYNFVAVGGTLHLGLHLSTFTGTLIGTFYFEKATIGGSDVFKVSVTDASFSVTFGPATLAITDVNGAFLINDLGSAGSLTVGSVSLTGITGFYLHVSDFSIDFNTTGADVTVDIPVNGGDPISLDFTGSNRHDFFLISGSIEVGIGGTAASPYVKLSADNVVVDTGATGTEHVFEAASLTGQLNIPTLGSITVTATNLAFTAEGKLDNLDASSFFTVSVDFGGTGDPTAPAGTAFKWPAWMPIQIQHLELAWADVGAHPDQFYLVLSAKLTLPSIAGVTVAGEVQNLVIDVGKLVNGDFPIVSFDSAGLSISGTIFGALDLHASLVVGMIKLNDNGDGTYTEVTDPLTFGDTTIFYAGISGGAELTSMGVGVEVRVGLAAFTDTNGDTQVIPLEAFLKVDAPILIEPISGLTLGSFTAGIQFDHVLDDYTNPNDLKVVSIASVTNPDLTHWADDLHDSALDLFESGGGGAVDVWSKPMTITAGAEFYSSYVSKQALDAQVLFQIDTTGKVLLIGELTTGGGNLKLAARFYADFSNADAGEVHFSFYADAGLAGVSLPGGPPFAIWGSLSVAVYSSSGTALTGDPDAPAALDAAGTTVKIGITGGARITEGGVLTVEVTGKVDIEITSTASTFTTKLNFDASIKVVNPPGNPLENDFAQISGAVVFNLYKDSSNNLHYELYGAVRLVFKTEGLKAYGIDLENVQVFAEFNTTDVSHTVTLTFTDHTTQDVTIAPESFLLYISGHVGVGTPADPTTHYLEMDGTLILQVDADGLTIYVDVTIDVGPQDAPLLTFDATGLLRINADGLAARLDMTLATDLPDSSGLSISGTFKLEINTTLNEVSYTTPDGMTTPDGTAIPTVTLVIPKSAPALSLAGVDLSTAADPAAAGEIYALVYADGTVTALDTFTLTGKFFVLVTPDEFSLAVDATLDLDPIGSLHANGELHITSDGAAGLLSASFTSGSALTSVGISFTGSFEVAFNTYADDYTLDDGTVLEGNLIRLELSGDASLLSGAATLTGRFFFEQAGSGPTLHTTIEVSAHMSLPVVGTINVDGSLTMNDDGAVGSLNASLVSNSGLSDIGITYSATIQLKINTTAAAAPDPLNTAVNIDANTVILDLSGSVTLINAFTFNGHFYFKKSGSNLNIRFDATLAIGVGTFKVTGAFDSSTAGITATLTMTLQSSSTLSSLGFNLHGDFLLAINTTNSGYTLSGLTGNLAAFNSEVVGAHGLLIYVKGGITLLDTLEITGTFKLSQGSGYLTIEIDANIDLAGLATVHLTGGAGIYSDDSSTSGTNEGGIALRLVVAVDSFGISGLFDASGTFTFELNTTGVAHTISGATLPHNSFHIAVSNLTLRFLSVLTITGNLDITYSGGVFRLDFSAGVDFFGLGSITADGFFDSDGNYSLHIHGHVSIGVEGFFGVAGSLDFHIAGVGEGITSLSGSINGTAWLVGIGFDVNVGINWTASTGRLRASVSITIDFFFFSVSFGGDFDLGYIKSTITYQAGTLTDPHAWDDNVGGDLYVNVGSRAASRNYSTDATAEQVLISQASDGRIEVNLFGKKKKYANVSSIHIDTGSDNDYVYIDPSVTVPVYITTGDGDDYVDGLGSGVETINAGDGNNTVNGGSAGDSITTGSGTDLIHGNGGNDTIDAGAGDDVIVGGAGNDSLTGGNGNDTFAWTLGDGTDTISGGAGANSLNLEGDANANTLTVSASGSTFSATMGGVTLTPTGIQTLFANMKGGADSVTFNDLTGTGLTSVNAALGDGDGAADTVTINGTGSNDTYRLNSTSNLLVVSKVTAMTDATPLVEYHIDQGSYPADIVSLNAGNGNDTIDAHNVTTAHATLKLYGQNGNDTILGSSFNDTIDGGANDDTLTGGPGQDTFADASGNDTLVETMDVNYTLDGWSLTAGSTTETLPSVFETIRLSGGDSDNTFTISNVVTTVTLDGKEGSDAYVITLAGSGLSTINITDSGTGVGHTNTNTLRVNGTSSPDDFLLRAGLIEAGVTTDHDEVINFAGVSSFEIYGGAGNDSFIIDETTTAGTIYGEAGADSFTVGRILTAAGTPAPTGIDTIATTRGHLSYGNRADLSLRGGDNNDYFEINHNQSEIYLYGEAGDDLFLLRTFLQEGSALSNVAGGTGTNSIQYVANGPVHIDGGEGFDRIVLEGTEADDVFIITDSQIFGGGRQVDFVNVESIVILGGLGNDTFWVLGNGLPLEIDGGSGNDTINIGGQAPDYVYDAPPVVVDPPPYTVYTPVYSDPVTITYTIAAHFDFDGSFPFFHWISEQTFSIYIPPLFLGFEATVIDPPPTTYDPPPITYHFANVTTFNGVTNGIEVYNSTNTTPVTPGPGVTPNSYINLGTIAAPLQVNGGNDTGIAGENDVMNVYLNGTTSNLDGRMITTPYTFTDSDGSTEVGDPLGQLLGFGLPDSFSSEGRTFMGGITFDGLETANFNFGSGNDSFKIESTFGAVDVTLNGSSGNDTFNVQANTGTVTLNGDAGTDTFNLGSQAPTMSGGNLNGLDGAIIVDGGSGTDSLNLDDRGDTGANTFTVTSTTLGGAGLGDGVTYSTTTEGLNVGLGSGADTVNVRTLNVPLNLNTGAGADQIYAGSNAGLGNTGGNVNGIASTLTVNGGSTSAVLNVDDTGDSATNTGTLTGTQLTGLGLGTSIDYSAITTLNINLGSGNDSFAINSTHTAATNLDAGGGNDTIAVLATSGPTSVNGAAGDDTVRISSVAPTATGGTLNAIAGRVTADGGTGTDNLYLDETGDSAPNSGTLTGSAVTGLGMTLGVNYANFDGLTLTLGSGNDNFTVTNTSAGTTTLVDGGLGADIFGIDGSTGALTLAGNDGDDQFNARATGGSVTLAGDAGNDTFNLGSRAPTMTGGNLNALAGAITVDGGAGTDSLNLDDRGDTGSNTLTVTQTTFGGAGLGAGVTYSTTTESLNVGLGSGPDTVNIRTLNVPLNLNTGAGADQIYVGTNAGLGNVNGNVNAIAATLTINGGSNTAVLNIDDTGDSATNTGTLTGTQLTGLGLGTSIDYSAITTLNINLGSGADSFAINSTHTAATNLDAGGGNDTIAILTTAGPTSVNGAAGDDTIRISSVAPTTSGGTLNGIAGRVTTDGGAGTNQLYLDDTGDATNNDGMLTGTEATGLGMTFGVGYANFATLNITLGSGNDTFDIASTHTTTTNLDTGLGDDSVNIDSIAGVTNVNGNNGADTITVNPNKLVGTNPIGAVLNLDGNDGGDAFTIWMAGAGSSVINVLDTGATGTDNLTLDGTPGSDTFLLRHDFVVLLQYDSNGQEQGSYERINYNAAIDGALTINAVGGPDLFAMDDNSTTTVINGSDQNDTFQIAQVFGNSFIGEGIAHGDLIATTRGLLSPGVTHRLTINGGAGNDTFNVFHNRAVLTLNGDAGDDTFVIRSFALAGSTEGVETYDPLRGSTNVATGGGANHVEYALNAPVAIDGGSGFNTIIVIATEFSDSIVVTKDGVYGGGLFVNFTNIQRLVILAAEGNDYVWILGSPGGAAVEVDGGLGSDTIELGGTPDPIEVADVDSSGTLTGTSHWVNFTPVNVLTDFLGPVTVNGGIGDGVPPLEPGVGLPGEDTGPLPDNGNPNLTVDENVQVDRLVVHNEDSTGPDTGMLTGDYLTGLGLPGATTIAGTAFAAGVHYLEMEETLINLGSGNDTFTVASTATGRTVLNTGAGADTVNLRTIAGHTTVSTGDGNDTINVGSLAPGTGGNLDGIDALLTIDGGAGTDTVNVDHRADTDGVTGWLTRTTLTGLEMTSDVSTVNDIVSYQVTATSGSYVLSHGSSQVSLAWNATADDLTGALWTLLGNRNAFAEKFGNVFLVHFMGSLKGQAVTLGVNTSALVNGSGAGTITATDRIDGVNYYGVDTLNVDLGSGADVFNVQGTTAVTNLSTHDGADRVYVSSGANLTTATSTDFLSGNLDNVTGTLNLDAGADRNLLMVSDEASTVGDGSVATPVLFTNSLIRGLAPADITYRADASAGSFAQGITVWSGRGSDVINVTSTDTRAGVRTATTLNTGAGNDQVTVTLNAATDGFFVLNTQAGDDTADASGSSLPVVVFGGDGADTIHGGSGSDILFGDEGRVHYANGSGTVVAVLGGGGPGDLTDGIVRDPTTIFTVNSTTGGVDTITGGDGSDVILGGKAGDSLNAGEGDNTVVGDHATITLSGGLVTEIQSDLSGGGDDTITTGAGRDVVVGGSGRDGIDAGAGDNAVLGDHGTINLSATVLTSMATMVSADGDIDTITTLGGNDVILGGEAGDTVNAGDGANVVLGDFGTITWSGGDLSTVSATAAGTGGADDITTGSGDDLVIGGALGDTIHASEGDNVILGDQGDITFTGGRATTLATAPASGDAGDWLYAGAGADVILGSGGADTIDAGDGANTVAGDYATIVRAVNGSILATTTVTSTALDVGGEDNITTGAGNDWIVAGAGADTVDAGQGDNVVLGDEGRIETSSFLVSLVVSDTGAYADHLTTGDGMDLIAGGGADDVIAAGAGTNAVLGDHGTITLTGGVLTQVLSTTSDGGNDTITAGADYNLVVGGFGTDEITTDGGVNVILGDQGRIDVNGTTLLDAYTFDANTGADDTIMTGDGSQWIFGGDGTDTITTGNGFAAVFGDHGRIDLAGDGTLTVVSLDFTSGADDTITTGSGDDIIVGGSGSDTIEGGEGNNTVVGDHGKVVTNSAGLVSVESLAPGEGAADTITTGAGNDVILGGNGADVIHAGAGRNLILGDLGSFTFDSGVLHTATSSDYTVGGDDQIDSLGGDDVIIGGFGADTIAAGDGDNIILGDHGTVTTDAGVKADIQTDEAAVGADDIITTGFGSDVILGGLGADHINAGEGENVIVGDHGSLHWIAGILARALSTDFAAGGMDEILSGGGADVILAGPADDTVLAGDGDNIVFGDSGSIYWTDGVIDSATSAATGTGGIDHIATGFGNDLVFGGTGDDDIIAGEGDNVVFGDNGEALFSSGIRSRFDTLAPADAGNDAILVGNGTDTVLAGAGLDLVTAGNGDKIIFGDEGKLIFESDGVLQDAISLAPDSGDIDTITAGAGNHVVFGGKADDFIALAFGDNVIFGDNGEAHWSGGIRTHFKTFSPENAGNDVILTMDGEDVILAGAGADAVTVGNGDKTVFGDEGELTYESGGILKDAISLATNMGAIDTITAGAGDHVVFGGKDNDVITLGNGDNVVFGDNGEAQWSGGVRTHFVTFSPEDAGNDTITTADGEDVILAGAGVDNVTMGDGNKTAFGDEGELTYESGGILKDAISLTADMGGVDTITAGAGDHVVLGGKDNDVITLGNGDNVVFGDNGEAEWSGGIRTHFVTFSPEDAGNDTITTADGEDVILAGAGVDNVTMGDGDKKVFGDEGELTYESGGILKDAISLAADMGGVDTITAGVGDHVVFGGKDDDVISLGNGDNVVFGDNGEAQWSGGVRTHFVTFSPEDSANDTITTGNGVDVILAGAGVDNVTMGDGDKTVFGDEGELTYEAGGILSDALSLTPDMGAADVILAGAGDHVVFGGKDDDVISLGNGDNVVFGDNGEAQWSGGIRTHFVTFSPEDAGNDTITTADGEDVILA